MSPSEEKELATVLAGTGVDTERFIKAVEKLSGGIPLTRCLLILLAAMLTGGAGGFQLVAARTNEVPIEISQRLDAIDAKATNNATAVREAVVAATKDADLLADVLEKRTEALTKQAQSNSVKLAGVESTMKSIEASQARQQHTLELILQRLPRN